MILRKERRSILESLNIIISERLTFVGLIADEMKLNKECEKHINPPNIVEPKYVPLTRYTLSGAFVLLLCLCAVAILIFLLEVTTHLIFKVLNSNASSDFELSSDVILFNNSFLEIVTPEGRDEVMQKYSDFLQVFDMYSESE
jgi:hypothetical protein